MKFNRKISVKFRFKFQSKISGNMYGNIFKIICEIQLKIQNTMKTQTVFLSKFDEDQGFGFLEVYKHTMKKEKLIISIENYNESFKECGGVCIISAITDTGEIIYQYN